MTDIKAIETWYKGFRFRSRLEARWAVFFDHLGIRWEYEKQGYALDGKPYLPDFWLPDQQVWAEVKGSVQYEWRGPHVDLCRALATGTDRPVMLLVDAPEARMYNTFLPNLSSYRLAFFRDYEPRIERIEPGDRYWTQGCECRERDGAILFPHDERGLRKSFGRGFVDGLGAARAARFEHGEQPS